MKALAITLVTVGSVLMLTALIVGLASNRWPVIFACVGVEFAGCLPFLAGLHMLTGGRR